ncbi:hypothetical protein HMPREF1986_02171 [Oribacterium sp. oral taxon 078 str. F0263]|nr:hypothetical protein HMPREF1986_02171 [Oribacterium sp. oral taxon 078 str. F0263]
MVLMVKKLPFALVYAKLQAPKQRGGTKLVMIWINMIQITIAFRTLSLLI